MATTKLCRDCIHVLPDGDAPAGFRFAKCELAKVLDLVSGDYFLNFAYAARTETQPCGPKGKLFEPNAEPALAEPASLTVGA